MTTISLASTSRPDTIQAHRRAVDRVIHAMYQNLARDFSLKDMAGVALISPYHFNRVFHQVAGMPPCQFLSALRLWQAKRLLVTTQLKVTDICFEVGYNSLGTFTRRFTDLVGVPPQRLRALARSEGIDPLLGRLAASFAAADHAGPSCLYGKATAPEGFRGPVFVGLFASPLPQGRPLACTVLAQPGPFHIANLPDGTFHLFAAAVGPEAHDAAELLLLERALRGTLRRPVKVRNGSAAAPVEVTLRPPEPIDPPILLTFPLLLAERLASVPRVGTRAEAVH